MPNFDGTGPSGLGPMTGGGKGFCVMPLGTVRFGRGGGRGCRNWYYATGLTGRQRASSGYPAFGRGFPLVDLSALGTKKEKQILKEEAMVLENELNKVKERITILEEQSKEE
ncbi:MAG: DUF5320 domain-containing protein [Candidatus Omnitrophota bacterium]|jgi:hypothetical protein